MQDVIFQYDGTFDGFLCCVFESYVYKEFPIAFYSDEECFSLYEVRSVITCSKHAQRVYRSLVKISRRAAGLIRRAFLTCMDDKELHLYAFIRKLYAEGPAFMKCQADEVYLPICRAVRHLNGELEKLRGFIRFSIYDGVLGAEIEPKNRVLPLLRSHFCNRYANEAFFIYDRTHKELLLYHNGRSRIVSVDHLRLSLPGEEELLYRRLWKCFYETIAIKERYNPRCQNTFLPNRYRGTMTEFLPTDYEVQQSLVTSPPASLAIAPTPFAQAEIPVPEIHE
ncbi:MAG: TIGR03915 family putative DNA repair protein [Clostridiales bacterium]|nr:TIGR03915 family putative DNA repair protein [Candidatus Cacconaster stercorequi]